MTLTVGSLFSGIGGLDLGLERAGMKVIWQSEIDPYACKVLKKHWPEVPNHGDIKQIDWRAVEPVDVICGGYPCQPFSLAGQRKGTDDPRHLWPWVRTAISELRPRYAILENVRGHLTMGGTQVIGELAEIGYDAEWRVVSAAGWVRPIRRERIIIIVAYPTELHSNRSDDNSTVSMESKTISKFGNSGGKRLWPTRHREGLDGGAHSREQ
jgi:DNA (cytosine-5)-methyltransferase 1